MSIILKALKKVQEQEAGQGVGQETGSPSGDTPVPGPPPTSVPFGERQVGAAPSPFARHAFGLGPKVLLGLLFVIGIATAGWFASSIYHVNSERESEIVAPKTPSVVEEPVKYVKAAEVIPAPGKTTPGVVEETAQPEPRPVAAVGQVPPPSPEPLKAPAAVTAIDVPKAKSPEKPAPAIKEAEPAKKGKPEFKINAIAWKNAEPRAIVNMHSVYEGDVIEGATVVAIKRKMIVFEYEGETFEVRFGI